MPTTKHDNYISEKEYLKGELISNVKHEYVQGQVYAMAGASPNHGKITGNIARHLGNFLENSSCFPYASDMKVKTSTGSYRYPDVVVVCDDNFIEEGYVTESPVIIFEVLSRTTRKIDEQEKLVEYINIPTLQYYVILEQNVVDVTVYSKADDWHSKHYFLDQKIHFENINMFLTVSDIYQRVQNEDMVEYLALKNNRFSPSRE
ncbi:MAG: hypothetical protein COB35_04600 [Gammaproteobacteria bacterium]|nr:MAG: hypothetical protein COB35_04600 [Gammaproteobacteria bacterium]